VPQWTYGRRLRARFIKNKSYDSCNASPPSRRKQPNNQARARNHASSVRVCVSVDTRTISVVTAMCKAFEELSVPLLKLFLDPIHISYAPLWVFLFA
jgi:hypothetical protein